MVQREADIIDYSVAGRVDVLGGHAPLLLSERLRRQIFGPNQSALYLLDRRVGHHYYRHYPRHVG